MKATRIKLVAKVLDIAHHRNGSCGDPFHAVHFLGNVGDDGATRPMVAVLFAEPASCAVLAVDRLDTDGVAFGPNSWRGDQFADELRPAIEKWERARQDVPSKTTRARG